ncbi:MAG: transcription termination factor Rho [Desulfobacteraceae bacterium]|nr:transcription termination factor Rho [Desulfobacteraceae bacterium]
MKPASGYLEIMENGRGFLRNIELNLQPKPGDTFVPLSIIDQLRLREGSFIQGICIDPEGRHRNPRLQSIESINGLSIEAFNETPPIQEQTSISPYQRFILTTGKKDLLGMALDRIVPIGRGQRGLIIAPPKTGKTTILKHMANAITANHPDATVFVLLVDERPEEVTDFKRGLKGAQVLSSSADQSIAQHMRMVRLAMNTALRWVETGRDAVVFIDSLTRMARAFNVETQSFGRTMSGGLGANALEIPRQIFGAARKLEEGGSMTIIATILIDTGSRMDDIIYQEFKGTGNMDLVLNRDCAEQRIWPAIDIKQSGTRKEELLLEKKEHQEIIKIRRGLAHLNPVNAMGAFLEYLNK